MRVLHYSGTSWTAAACAAGFIFKHCLSFEDAFLVSVNAEKHSQYCSSNLYCVDAD